MYSIWLTCISCKHLQLKLGFAQLHKFPDSCSLAVLGSHAFHLNPAEPLQPLDDVPSSAEVTLFAFGRMPTLASVHSSQATIGLEVQPAQPGSLPASSADAHSISGLVMDHSRLHLVTSPWPAPLHQALKAFGTHRNGPQKWGESSAQTCLHTANPVLYPTPSYDGNRGAPDLYNWRISASPAAKLP